ncbi:MAG TPA: hypothetical protein VHZ98_07000 [Galbitalea sp.]|jgi:hypothetical protein|nr:hypothetical protein [Galbitalea sp.]
MMRRRLLLGALTGALLVVMGIISGAGSAAASEGSAPVQVADFVGAPLTAKLAEFYGPDASGGGVKFNATTTYSTTYRIFAFTPEFDSGTVKFTKDGDAVAARRLNSWLTGVTVDKKLVGVARVGYSVTTGAELISFSPDTQLAVALPALPAAAELIHDTAHKAWMSLTGTTVAPIESGSTNLTTATSLDAYPRAAASGSKTGTALVLDPGVIGGAITLVLIAVIIGLVLLLPRRSRTPLA